MKYLVSIFIFLSIGFLHAAEPGFAFNFDGQNTYANLGEVLNNTKSISFWIKLNQNISAFTLPQTVLMRDNNSKSQFGEGETGIYFEGLGNLDAGKLVFVCSSGQTQYSIASDQDYWKKDIWYHISVVVHPSNGLEMYINGVKQTNTEPNQTSIYKRSEGPTGSLFLGKWGPQENYYLDAELDELCFYSTALSLQQIRSGMCNVQFLNANINDHYQFDTKSINNLTNTGASPTNNTLYNTTAVAYKKSSAPIGQSSVYDYQSDWSGKSLSKSHSYTIEVDSILSAAAGVHIYYTFDPTMGSGIDNRGWFGVWFTDTNSTYRARFDFSALSLVCDSCAFLRSRDDASKSNWLDRTGYQGNCEFELIGESTNGKNFREEYSLLDSLKLEAGFGDTAFGCTGDRLYLTARTYPGATYVWNDTIFQQSMLATSEGYHFVRIKYKGCETIDTVYVVMDDTPEFYLPNDTAICEGDTLWITAPVDSAEYLWLGFYTQRTFGIYAAGTYNLKITIGKCSAVDEIKVDVIPSFSINLGPDTSLCLGQDLSFSFQNNGVDYLWSDGSSSSSRYIFNEPGLYWVKAWNSCFEKSDTVKIEYEECDCEVFFPSAFTPNSDDVNDFFKAVTSCYYEEFELDILNRWGDLVYQLRGVNDKWDGLVKGEKAPEGVYSYRVRYKKYSWMKENKYEYGTFTLIR